MKWQKKAIALLLAAAMTVSACPITASAEELPQQMPVTSEQAHTVAEGACGENMTWVLTEDGTLTISGTGQMDDYYIAPWWENRSSIQRVVVQEGVTSVTASAFDSCSNLVSVELPQTLILIRNNTFYGCTSLTDIVIPDGVISIGDNAFYGCTGLTEITIPSSVFNIGDSAFFNCGGLTEITIPGGMTSMGHSAFSGCSGLTDVIILEGVTRIDGNTFIYCHNVVNIVLPESITAIGYGAFSDCHNLRNVYYAGNEAQWENVAVGTDNGCILYATKHYQVRDVQAHMGEPVVSPATCTQHGTITQVCLCGYEDVGQIPALGHDLQGNTCTRCGETISGYLFLAEIETAGETAIIEFIPETSGVRYFYSDSRSDTYGYLYDESMNELRSNDDGAENSNFLMDYYFEAGKTYYLGAKFYGDDQTGQFYVRLTDEFDGVHAHMLAETVAPTCETEGYSVYRCALCGDEYISDYVSSRNHVKGERIEQVLPTCQYDGYSIYLCVLCGMEFTTDWVSSMDHVAGECLEVVLPTCIDMGYSEYLCDLCGMEYRTDWLDPLGHDVENGTCGRCGKEVTNISWLAEITTAGEQATLTFVPPYSGTYYFYGDTPSDTVGAVYDSDMNQLYFNDDGGANKDFFMSFHMEAGETYHLVAWYYNGNLTGEFYVRLTDVFTDYHTYELVGASEPTCTTVGCTLYRCTLCGQEYQEDVEEALGHDVVDGVCTRCGASMMQQQYVAQILSPGEIATFEFVPDVTGEYVFWSESDEDTYGYLYNSDMGILASDDDGGEALNFSISYFLVAGETYYLGARFLNNRQTGDFLVYLSEAADNAEHNYVVYEVVEPTCQMDGYTVYQCTHCGEYRNTNWTPVLEHEFGEMTLVVPPTCTEQGYSLYPCVMCGEEYQRDWTDPLGHIVENGICTGCGVEVWEAWYVAEILSPDETAIFEFVPECTGWYYFWAESNYDTFGEVFDSNMNRLDCNDDNGSDYDFRLSYFFVAGETYYLGASFLGHNGTGRFDVCLQADPDNASHTYVLTEEREATCEQAGYAYYQCVDCGEGDYVYKDHLGHLPGEKIGEILPTCMDTGYSIYQCPRCDGEYNADWTDPLGHIVENGVCTGCGLEIWEERFAIEIAEPGEMALIEFVPGITGTFYFWSEADIPVFGRVYDAEMNMVASYYPGWDNCNFKISYFFVAGETYYLAAGFENGDNTGRFDVCLQEDPDNANHSYELIEVVEPTCAGAGYSVYQCMDCGVGYNTSWVPSLEHEVVEKIDEVLPTCTEYGCAIYRCTQCNMEYMDDWVEPLGHDVQDDICIRCGATVDYGDLEFILSESGDYYCVTGIGTFSGTELVIPDTYEGLPVGAIAAGAFADCSQLTSVTIPSSVTAIGANAFISCWRLTTVQFQKGSQLTVIGEYAFGGCGRLTGIILPEGLLSIGYASFSGCTDLTRITIPASVVSIGYAAFGICENLESIQVAAGNAAYHMADNCLIETETGVLMAALPGAVIPNDGSITAIAAYAFSFQEYLTSVVIPEGVTVIDFAAFCGCSNLTQVSIPASVVSIGYVAFAECSALTSIYFAGTQEQWEAIEKDESWDADAGNYTVYFGSEAHMHSYSAVVTAPTATAQGYTTYTCACGESYRDNFVEPVGFDASILLEGMKDQYGITELFGSYFAAGQLPTSIIRNDFRWACWTTGAFAEYMQYETIDSYGNKQVTGRIPGDVVEAFLGAHYTDQELVNSYLRSYTDLESNFWAYIDGEYHIYMEGVGGFGDYAPTFLYLGYEVIENAYVVYGYRVDTINPDDYSEYIPSEDEVEGVDYITIWTGYGVEFAKIRPQGIKAVMTIKNGTWAFTSYELVDTDEIPKAWHIHSYKETAVVAPTCTTQGYTTYTCACGDSQNGDYTGTLDHEYANGICQDCGAVRVSEGLEFTLNAEGTGYIVTGMGICTDGELVIPTTHEGLPVVAIGESAFENCMGILHVVIPGTVTRIERYAFRGCENLQTIILSGDAAQSRARTLPGTITIGEGAFENCSSLTTVILPENVGSIGEAAFRGCDSLTSIVFEGSQDQWDAIEKGDAWNESVGDLTVDCTKPAGILGDVTGDGKVTAADYARLALHVKGLRPIEDEALLALADVTGDGRITAADYAMLARIVKGLA